VDSDMSLLEQQIVFLIRYGWHVATATTGLECVARWRSFQPDVIVLDPDIPWGGGDGVLAVLNEEIGGLGLPVVLLTAEPQLDEVWRTLEYPVSDLAIKPIDPHDLLRRIAHVLSHQERDDCLQLGAVSSVARSTPGGIRFDSAVATDENISGKPLARIEVCRSTPRPKTHSADLWECGQRLPYVFTRGRP